MRYKSKREWSRILSVCCYVGVCLGGSAALAGTSGAEVHLTIAHGKMTATLEQVTLKAVLDAIERHTGIRAEFPPTEAERTLSARLQAVPLVEALRELLAPWNYVLRVDAQGTLRRIIILGQKETAPQSTAPPPSLGDGHGMQIEPARQDAMQIIFPRNTQGMQIELTPKDAMQIIFPRDPQSMGIVPDR
jgi:hypothetical protein